MTIPPILIERRDAYCRRHHIAASDLLGQGKDGCVWKNNRHNAVKIHGYVESYTPECDAYIRLRERNIVWIAGFRLPRLIDFDDELLAIEMSVVTPPYLLDFASATLDSPPDLIEDEGHTLADLVFERFGERAAEIFYLRQQLEQHAGIYLIDIHPHNIKFSN
jgi:hypothetical protein